MRCSYLRRIGFALALALLSGTGAAAQASGSVYGWLRAYAGKRARDVARDPLFRPMLELSVPPWGMSIGPANELSDAVAWQMGGSSRRVELRDGRYLDFAGYRPDGGAAQSFFWVDLDADRAIGAMYVCLGRSGGCAQQMLIFARQPQPITSETQLPADFVTALAAWQRRAGNGHPDCRVAACSVPAVLQQYFIGLHGRNLLLHAIGTCAAGKSKEIERCRSAEREASELDLQAAWSAVSAATPVGDLLPAEQAEGAWFAQRDQRCGSAGANPDCYTLANEQRAGVLLAGWLRRGPTAMPRRRRLPLPRMASPPVAPVSCRPVANYQPDPGYTDAARAARFEGSVRARIMIAPDGRVVHVTVLNPVGYGMDQEVVQTLGTWRFRPVAASCPRVNQAATVSVNFHLGIQYR